jgi:tRNA A37 threonylcarbamoyladenosine modification protein TsaB
MDKMGLAVELSPLVDNLAYLLNTLDVTAMSRQSKNQVHVKVAIVFTFNNLYSKQFREPTDNPSLTPRHCYYLCDV